MVKLLKIVKSDKPLKKWTAIFKLDNDKEKKVNFGYYNKNDLKNDYTLHMDKERRERYRKRHAKDLKTNDPMRAGYLSFYILWGDSTSFRKNVASYKKRFDL
tara:strand:+ start:4073 stop:4378 length:306 start_codon:yes stop_codon:yes gene_type:complete